jgi:RNA polymerase sigma-70 factor, ECF subfamily
VKKGAELGENVWVAEPDPEWERIPAQFQGYLMAMARAHINPRLRAKLGPESMVQETLLEAYRDRAKFRGTSPPELAAYLRAILVRNIRDAVRALGRGKRNADLEVSLVALERASFRVDQQMASQPATPEAQLDKLQEVLRFVQILSTLPAAERDVLELRHLQGLSLKEVSEALGCSYDSARRLCSQGERRLRAQFEAPRPP